MAIYTKPNMSFIDTYTNAAKYRDQRTADANKLMMQGVENLVKGGAEAYKWQERKDLKDKLSKLDAREKEILDEIERIKAGRSAGMSSNMEAIMQSTGWKGVPFPYSAPVEEKNDSFVAPQVGLGIFKKELL